MHSRLSKMSFSQTTQHIHTHKYIQNKWETATKWLLFLQIIIPNYRIEMHTHRTSIILHSICTLIHTYSFRRWLVSWIIHSKVTKKKKEISFILVNSIEITEMNVDEIGTFVCAHSFICHITVFDCLLSHTHTYTHFFSYIHFQWRFFLQCLDQ